MICQSSIRVGDIVAANVATLTLDDVVAPPPIRNSDISLTTVSSQLSGQYDCQNANTAPGAAINYWTGPTPPGLPRCCRPEPLCGERNADGLLGHAELSFMLPNCVRHCGTPICENTMAHGDAEVEKLLPHKRLPVAAMARGRKLNAGVRWPETVERAKCHLSTTIFAAAAACLRLHHV